MSTLRDPNSLGAYLIVPLMLLVERLRTAAQKKLILVLIAVHALALWLTFSRAALGGMLVALFGYIVLQYGKQAARLTRRWWPVIGIGFVVIVISVVLLRDNYYVQNIVFHADENTQAQLDSN